MGGFSVSVERARAVFIAGVSREFQSVDYHAYYAGLRPAGSGASVVVDIPSGHTGKARMGNFTRARVMLDGRIKTA